MRPLRARGPRQLKALTFAAVLVASILLVAPAIGSYGLLAVFGETGSGPGTLGPHAPALAVDPDGRIYVADAKDARVEAFTNAGAPDGGWGGLTGLTGVAADPDGTILVADDSGVRRFALDGTELETVSSETGVAGIAVGPDGTVYVADPEHHQVLVLGGAPLGGLERPIAVAAAPDGTVYVADPGDGRVHAFSGGAPLASWAAGDPRSVAVAPDGTIFVVDGTGNRVLHQGADGSAIEEFGGVNAPNGVATDCRGRAYVVDNSALRMRVFGEAGEPPPCPPPPPPPPPERTPDPEPEPEVGVRARASAVSGTVTVATAGKKRKLGSRELIPVGSEVDATDGHVRLEFETAPGEDRSKYGRLMDGEFFDGAFTISQNRGNSLVDLELRDDDTPARSSAKARVSATKKLKVWGKARGRFRTVGRNGAATVRGTEWLTEERDDGTLFAVREGVVEVNEFRSGRKVVLHAGESYLAKPPCVSKRAFRIRLRTRAGAAVRRAVVRVNGKRVGVRRGRRLTAPVDLRGMPEARVKVDIRLTTVDGQVIAGRRFYHTCREEPLSPTRPPEL
jgi:hypothetical protein